MSRRIQSIGVIEGKEIACLWRHHDTEENTRCGRLRENGRRSERATSTVNAMPPFSAIAASPSMPLPLIYYLSSAQSYTILKRE